MPIIKKLLKPKNYFAVSLILFIFAAAINITISINNFPSNLYILADEEYVFDFSAPFKAKIEPDAMAVVNVNSEPVTDNIQIDLNKENSIETDSETSFDMVVSLFGLPVKTVSVDVLKNTEVVPCGMTVGVRFFTDGVLVLGTGSVTTTDGTTARPSEGALKAGDILLEIDGLKLESKEQLINIIEKTTPGENLTMKLQRNKEILSKTITPVIGRDDNKNKIGVWVRDSTQGIGTITYYNPETKSFGALGHGILDVDTKKLMTVRSGILMESNIISIRKGKKGSPGELIGEINASKTVGTIVSNNTLGLFGSINSSYTLPKEKMKIALQGQVHDGPAVILSNINGNEIKQYDIYIESVNKYNSDEAKGMVIRITDQELITKTNGIVQGMSGSPIIQDGKLIGAVTHVFVQNPLKGYGIFIENMLKQEKGA